MAVNHYNKKKYVDRTAGAECFREEFITQWNYLMAATTLIMLPLLIMYIFMQKYFVEGIVTTGIKG